MDAQMKTVLDEVKGLLAQEREANDERLAEIEKTGTELPELRAKTDKTSDAVNHAVEKLEAVQKQTEANAEHIASLTVGGAGEPKQRDELAKNATVFYAGMRKAEHPITVSDEEIEAYVNYSQAFSQFLRRGDGSALADEYRNLMSVGSDPDGGYWVPTEQRNEIIQKLFESSPMRSVADTITITGDSVEWPNDTNDATSGGWVGEYDARTETATQKVGRTQIYVREQYAMPQVTQKLLDMATIDPEAWLNGKIADKMARTENTAFVSGTGVDQPRGFLDYKSAAVTTDDATRSWGVLQQVVTGASGAFNTVSGSVASDPDPLITIISKLNPAYRAGARWVMNRATEAAVRKLKDADGRYFVQMGDMGAGTFGFNLFGFPITTAEDMPDIAANSYSIAFGNFMQGYQIVDGRGLRVLRDPYTTKGQVKFYTTKWTGGDVVNSDAIKLLKFSS